jgi:hypothetical protein
MIAEALASGKRLYDSNIWLVIASEDPASIILGWC